MADAGIAPGSDGRPRCRWAVGDPDYERYHDTEWGFPQTDDHRLFEKVCLEGFQAGLSWLTILRKRDDFRRAFSGFDPAVVADYTDDDVERLLGDAGIVRHRGKIEATITNARRALDVIAEHGSLAAFFWSYEPVRQSAPPTELAATTPDSEALSRDLKRGGWRFVGPTTMYAFMQAMGLVNDHLAACVIRDHVVDARSRMTHP